MDPSINMMARNINMMARKMKDEAKYPTALPPFRRGTVSDF
jgi:hypothetical protein